MGHLITFAGIDGSGKTTQAQRLADWLRETGFEAELVPHSNSRYVRQLLDRVATAEGFPNHRALLGVDTERLLAAIAKWQSLDRLREILATPNGIAVTDRGAACQFAGARVFGASNESQIRAIFSDLQQPLITLYLAVPGGFASDRVAHRGIDSHTAEKLNLLDRAYRSLPEFEHFTVIDGSEPEVAVQRAIRSAVQDRLHNTPRGT